MAQKLLKFLLKWRISPHPVTLHSIKRSTYVVATDDVDDDGESGIDCDVVARFTDGTRDRDRDKFEKAFPIDIPVAGEDRPLGRTRLNRLKSSSV